MTVQKTEETTAKQQPDTKSGCYYVSAVYNGRKALLLGPFVNNHAKALEMVDAAREKVYELDSRAPWYAYGTCRTEPDYHQPGKLNHLLGVQTEIVENGKTIIYLKCEDDSPRYDQSIRKLYLEREDEENWYGYTDNTLGKIGAPLQMPKFAWKRV